VLARLTRKEKEMIKVEKAVEGLENVTTLRELTETVVGKAVIANFAKIGKLKDGHKVTPLLIKAAILARGQGKGELCQEFVRVVRKVVVSSS
tara:strand:+ start:303 stop:578 length:276 start_codon:yes stop_codon:yes gene_type:complete